jgi:6-hydroxy-3-succinoylpyridine 3-monooxygenase
MQKSEEIALRTRVYIDGYNLYYGCLKNSPHKWLDVRALVKRILSNIPYGQNGQRISYSFQSPAIKHFTAPILATFARAEDSVACQSQYYSALCAHLGGDLQLINGYHDAKLARAHAWEEGRAARECEMIEIWKLEEKQSDVALALHMYSDAIRNEVDQVVAVTNDADFAPALAMIRQHTPAIVGLIVPTRLNAHRVNTELGIRAHWIRAQIRDEELAASQLPAMIRLKNKVVHKPLSWYPRPDLLVPVYNEAKRVKCSEGAARKWLNEPCAHLGGQVPIVMCESDELAGELRDYMDRYAREFKVA